MDRETVVAHLHTLNSWARHDLEYGWHKCGNEVDDIARWTKDAVALLDDLDTQLRYRDEVIAEQEKEIRRLEEELAKRPDVVRCKDCEYAPGNELGFVCKIRDHFGAFMHDPDNFYCSSGRNKNG